MAADIIGWGHTRFGRSEQSLEQLIAEATTDAIDHAGVDPRDIGEVVLGHYNGGMNDLAFASGLVARAHPELSHTPALRVENACASGGAAVHLGARLAESSGKPVLVVGAEKMTGLSPERVGRALMAGDYDRAGEESTTGFAQLFADVATAYAERFGDPSDELAAIAAKNHRNGVDNPYAQFRVDLGEEYCRADPRNPIVAAPLRRTDCAPLSDGAAALVIVPSGYGPAAAVRVHMRGLGSSHDRIASRDRDPVRFEGPRRAIAGAMSDAGLTLPDMDFAEIHDCFTIAELLIYEAMGLAETGRGRDVVRNGTAHADGALPINRSGGLKAKGHPIGATGVSQHVMTAMQLTGQAGAMQLGTADVGLVFNMGGIGIANYATVLSR